MDGRARPGTALQQPSRERPFWRRHDRHLGVRPRLHRLPGCRGPDHEVDPGGAIKVFTDVRSGRSMDRQGLQELLAYARRGDTLAVVRLDRLGRSLAELLATVTMLKERGIALLSLEEKIDTSSAAGELIFHVFGAIAHFERRLIAERTKDGIAAARAKGKQPGRQPLDCERVSAALKLVAAGLSPSAAARQIGLGRSTDGGTHGGAPTGHGLARERHGRSDRGRAAPTVIASSRRKPFAVNGLACVHAC